MSSNANTHIIHNGSIDHNGSVWYRLHSERESICEELLKESEATHATTMTATLWHRELLQSRLRKIDDALDRLLSGSYGSCSSCGRWIEDTKLEFDPAIAFCIECWQREQAKMRATNSTTCSIPAGPANAETDDSALNELTSVNVEELQPFDTIYARTLGSGYRILLLDPKTGRAVIEGGRHLDEPMEGIVNGSSQAGAIRAGWLGNGFHLEMWINDSIIRTSPIQSLRVEHNSPDRPLSS